MERVHAEMEKRLMPMISQILRGIRELSGSPDQMSVNDLVDFINSEATAGLNHPLRAFQSCGASRRALRFEGGGPQCRKSGSRGGDQRKICFPVGWFTLVNFFPWW